VDARDFVRQEYGEAGLARVLAELPQDASRAFGETIREVGWYPLVALDLYLKAACRLLASGSLELCRSQGRFAAGRQKAGFLTSLVSTPALRVRTAPIAWRLFYDVGRLEVVGRDPETAVGRIHGFPATPELCTRFLGIWEGIVGSGEAPSVAEEARCVRHGDPYCEIHVRSATS